MSKRLPIHLLKPAAARLWIAAMTQEEGETYDDIVMRSGISEYQTFKMARQQLRELGFFIVREGRECPTYYAEDPERPITEPYPTIPYPGTITKITHAKQ